MLFVLVVFGFTHLVDAQDHRKRYDRYTVWSCVPNDQKGVQFLQNLFFNGSDLNLDFWNEPNKVGDNVQIMVDDISLPTFKNSCTQRNISMSMWIENVQKLVDTENQMKRQRLLRDDLFKFSNFYPNMADIEIYIKELRRKYPNYVEYQEIATTFENRKVLLIKMTNKANIRTVQKKAIWIDAGIHAREWISPVTSLYFVDQLLSRMSVDPKIRSYLDNIIWYVAPVLNPDGYAYTHSKDRMWRKNRRRNSCVSGAKCCDGVDLNRNFGFFWNTGGSSPNTCTEVYHGSSAFSEPEAKGVRNFIMANKEIIKAYLTLHSFGQLWTYPFGYKHKTYSDDKDELVTAQEIFVTIYFDSVIIFYDAIAKLATKELASVSGAEYSIGSTTDLLYAASGASSDWAKGVAGIKYVYTVELRPNGKTQTNGFLLSADKILATGEETWKAVCVVADAVLKLN